MAKEKFKIGDVVKLVSGGPKMTVSDDPGKFTKVQVFCQWFAGAKLESGYFPEESLELVQDDLKE